MEIVVLLKQVPATESVITIADDGLCINTDDVKWVINPYDELAVEEALRIKESQGGAVTILSVGPEHTVNAIRSALAMGADKGILINDADAGKRDGLAIAQMLSAALKEIPFDLIIAGQRAVDDDNFVVGIAVAEYLNLPSVSLVNKAEISDQKILFHRTVEGGTVVLETTLPALFTTQRGLNEPRYTSLPGIMKAKKKPLDIKSPEDLGVNTDPADVNRTKLLKLSFPPARKAGQVIEGETAQEKAAELARLLHEDAKVI